MRGLLGPELFNIVDDVYELFENPAKPRALQKFPVVYIEEHPFALRGIRPFRKCAPIISKEGIAKSHTEVAKPSKQDFNVTFDVSSFKPEEISVKLKDRDVIIEASHEERQDGIGFISRQFTRRYTLPEEYDSDTISTYLNADGKMTIKALKPKPIDSIERIIPIKRVAPDEFHEEICEEEIVTAKKSKNDSNNHESTTAAAPETSS
jgi:HSP20 family molecular chaperone IbpA